MSLYARTNLLGSIINVETGEWIDSVGGIMRTHSFYEYALKSYVMFGDESTSKFSTAIKVMKYYHKSSGWSTK